MPEILYGIRNSDEKTVSIDDISNEMVGLNCDCRCPACGRPLQACSLKGRVRRYFRHHTESTQYAAGINCDALTANETALHRMAKSIIEKEKRIFVPSRGISCAEAKIQDIPQTIKNKLELFVYQKEAVVEGISVEIEKHLNGFIPDVSITTARGELLVEIFVRHKVNALKLEKVREYGAAMLELDLSDYLETPISQNEIREIILSKTTQKKWRYYPFSNAVLEKARLFYENQEEVLSYRKAEAERKEEAIEQQKKEAKRQLARENGQKKLDELFQPQNYSEAVKKLRNDNLFVQYCNKFQETYWYDFGKEFHSTQTVPFFVDIPITGEMIFQCDRRIWQSLVFNRYVFGRKNDEAKFDSSKIFDVLVNQYRIPVDYDLTYKLKHPWSKGKNIWLRQDVIVHYLEYLEILGFIETPNWRKTQKQWKTVLAKKTITPPDMQAAEDLIATFKCVKLDDPEIDNIIYTYMKNYFM